MNTQNPATQTTDPAFAAGLAHMQAGAYLQAAAEFCTAVANRPADIQRGNYVLFTLYMADTGVVSDKIKNCLAGFLANPLLLNVGLLLRVWTRIMRQDPAYAPFFVSGETYESFRARVGGLDTAPLTAPFFLNGLCLTVIPDIDVERGLTYLRRYLLEQADAKPAPWMLPVAEALALCCFNNEYVFAEHADETAARQKLLTQKSPSAFVVALIASYEHILPHERLVQYLSAPLHFKLRSALDRLITQQISEPRAEIALHDSIPAFGTITDDVSQKVRAQYEENPYPRWINIGHIVNDEGEIPLPRLQTKAKPAILVAGCATGRYPIGVAVMRPQSFVTGVDLSRASIAYASRMARKHGVKNLQFVQGDILAIAALDRRFDMIETVGVLHHMKEPEAGLAALLSVLNPDGYIKIGLYSATARRHLTACATELQRMNLPPTLAGIRAAREFIMGLAEDHPYRTMLKYDDFYSTSMIRDMLFHVQEHLFTLPRVKKMLDDAGLRFMGFVNVAPAAHAAFQAMFPDPADRLNLDCWHKFEQDNPDCFIGMYKFWCEKI